MYEKRINDAAIAVHKRFKQVGLSCYFFGGYAMSALGRQRETDNIQCLVPLRDHELANLLDESHGFYPAPVVYPWEDRLFILWSNKISKCDPVLFEFYCIGYEGCPSPAEPLKFKWARVEGETVGQSHIKVLAPSDLFKLKLHAAAARTEFYDSADLRYLADKYAEEIKESKDKLSLRHVGVALKNHPELSYTFEQIGFDIARAKALAVDLGPLKVGDVQRILCE